MDMENGHGIMKERRDGSREAEKHSRKCQGPETLLVQLSTGSLWCTGYSNYPLALWILGISLFLLLACLIFGRRFILFCCTQLDPFDTENMRREGFEIVVDGALLKPVP